MATAPTLKVVSANFARLPIAFPHLVLGLLSSWAPKAAGKAKAKSKTQEKPKAADSLGGKTNRSGSRPPAATASVAQGPATRDASSSKNGGKLVEKPKGQNKSQASGSMKDQPTTPDKKNARGMEQSLE